MISNRNANPSCASKEICAAIAGSVYGVWLDELTVLLRCKLLSLCQCWISCFPSVIHLQWSSYFTLMECAWVWDYTVVFRLKKSRLKKMGKNIEWRGGHPQINPSLNTLSRYDHQPTQVEIKRKGTKREKDFINLKRWRLGRRKKLHPYNNESYLQSSHLLEREDRGFYMDTHPQPPFFFPFIRSREVMQSWRRKGEGGWGERRRRKLLSLSASCSVSLSFSR